MTIRTRAERYISSLCRWATDLRRIAQVWDECDQNPWEAWKAVAASDQTGQNVGSTTTRGCRRIAMATTAEQSRAQRQGEGEQQYGELLA
jgi:hypothetical protein